MLQAPSPGLAVQPILPARAFSTYAATHISPTGNTAEIALRHDKAYVPEMETADVLVSQMRCQAAHEPSSVHFNTNQKSPSQLLRVLLYRH